MKSRRMSSLRIALGKAKLRGALALAALLVFGSLTRTLVSSQSAKYAPFDLKISRRDEEWVRNTLGSLTLDEKIGQMIIAHTNVVFVSLNTSHSNRLHHPLLA